jgi:hypothetical protein
MILQNLEWDEREAAQIELERLADALRGDGFAVEVSPLDASTLIKIEESAAHVAVDVLNVVLDRVENDSLDAVIGAVGVALFKWAKGRTHFRNRDGGKATARIWGPNEEVLTDVALPEPGDDTYGQWVQILTRTEDPDVRVFQLSPDPTERWWKVWHETLNRWLTEVGRLPADVDISASPPHAIIATGVNADNAEYLDRALSALVLTVNRWSVKPPRN